MFKLVIFYGGFLSRVGGAFHHAESFKRVQQENGQDIKVITLDDLPFLLKYLPHCIERLFNYFYLPYGYIAKGLVIKVLFRMLRIRANAFIFEDIYFSWNSSTPSVTVLHAVWSDNLQGKNINNLGMDSLRRWEAKIINAIEHPLITVSEPYRQYLCAEHFSAWKIRDISVVELGIHGLKKITELGSTPVSSGKKLIYCGALEPRKNVRFLLEVMEALQRDDNAYSLTIVGDGVDRNMLMTQAKMKNLNVEFLGRLDYEVIPRVLRRHEIYIHTSVKESFSFSLLEAKLTGLKTIAFKNLQVPIEFIDVGVADFKHSSWVAAIQTAQTFPPKASDLMRFDAQNMVSRTLALLPPKE